MNDMLTLVKGTHVVLPKLNRYWTWIVYMEDGDLYVEASWDPDSTQNPKSGGVARISIGHSSSGEVDSLANMVSNAAHHLAQNMWHEAFPQADQKLWAIRRKMVKE